MGEAVWLGGAGDRAETSIDRFQSVRGVLGGESRRCDRGLRVIVVPRWCQEKDFWWFVALSVFRRDCMVGWCRNLGKHLHRPVPMGLWGAWWEIPRGRCRCFGRCRVPLVSGEGLLVVYGAVGVSARLHGRLVPEIGLRPLSTGSNRSVGCWVGNPAGAIEVSGSVWVIFSLLPSPSPPLPTLL